MVVMCGSITGRGNSSYGNGNKFYDVGISTVEDNEVDSATNPPASVTTCMLSSTFPVLVIEDYKKKEKQRDA